MDGVNVRTLHFYDQMRCSIEIFRNLAVMATEDERMTGHTIAITRSFPISPQGGTVLVRREKVED